jgi:hypothetical protein
MTRDITLITNLLQMPSLPVLVDWIEFLPRPPKTLICYVGGDAEIEAALHGLCDEHGIALILVPTDLTEDIRKSELPVILWQMQNAPEDYVLRVTLDTIPYRTDDADWLSYCIETMEAEHHPFTTGSTRPFRADRPLDRAGFGLTRRVSFNFILMRARFWLDLEARSRHLMEKYDRYYIEGLLEDFCEDTDRWGLRLINIPERRVFHVQVWDSRIDAIRRAFHEGRDLGPHLRGHEDDQNYDWDRYYMWPKPSWLKRARIHFGKWRRSLSGGR